MQRHENLAKKDSKAEKENEIIEKQKKEAAVLE